MPDLPRRRFLAGLLASTVLPAAPLIKPALIVGDKYYYNDTSWIDRAMAYRRADEISRADWAAALADGQRFVQAWRKDA